jgi:hypothetical protein
MKCGLVVRKWEWIITRSGISVCPPLDLPCNRGGYGFIDDIWNQVMHDVIGYYTTVKHEAWIWVEWDTPSRRMLEKKDKDESGI